MKTQRLVRALGCFVAVLGMGAASSAQAQTGLAGVLQFPAQNPAIGHQIGFAADSNGDWLARDGSRGFLSFGPYTTISLPGDYVAVWTLGATFNTPDGTLANLDVNDATTQTEIATRQPLPCEFAFPGSTCLPQNPTPGTFTLPFTVDSTRAGHQFEFRVFWFGNGEVEEHNLGYVPLQWNAQNLSLGHQIGRADNGGWSASVFDGQGFVQYGHYTALSAPGNYVALWTLQVDNNTNDNNAVAIVDVNDAITQTRLQSLQILRGEFLGVHTDQVFQLPFTIDPSLAGHQFEFRIFYTGVSYVREQAVGVVQTP